jgi:DNA-binding GntR family transcriptional regulator
MNTSPRSVPPAPMSRTAFVAQELRRAILAGELQAGQALVETDLAATFAMSKTPVREALKSLASAGLITMNEYRGASVRVVDATMAQQVFDMRMLLEPVAVERAALAGYSTAEARLALERADAAEGPGTRSLENRDFHQLLYAACGNPLLIETLDGLRDQTALITVAAWRNSISWRHEAGEHLAILEAVERGDAAEARRLEEIHIANFAKLALTQLETNV